MRFDLQSENFDDYFVKLIEEMTEQQKEELPQDMLYRVGNRGSLLDTSSMKMPFFAKLYVLMKAFKKRCIIIVEDEDAGMTAEDFFKVKKDISKHNFDISSAGKLTTSGTFVLGNKELCDSFHLLNLLSASPAYRYLVRGKNRDVTRLEKWLTSMDYINRFLSHYEANRKRIVMNTGITMAEWLVLIYLYHRGLVPSSTIYKEWYKYSYNSSATKIKLSFSHLKERKYVEKIGMTKKARIRITALGKDKVNEIMTKYVLNC